MSRSHNPARLATLAAMDDMSVSYDTEQSAMTMPSNEDPTRDQWGAYAGAFDYFNAALFDGELSRCILNFDRRARRAAGFFAPERWERSAGRTHEISLNPDVLKAPVEHTMSTLVHEMTHLWQHKQGKPSRRGYHNRQWADKLESIGLMPSSTGKPGGKRTGQRMSDYVIAGGRFDLALQAMPHECLLPWLSGSLVRTPGPDPKDKNKVRYTCPGCGANVWGKPDLEIICTPCRVPYETTDPGLPPKPMLILRDDPEEIAKVLADRFKGDALSLFALTFQDETDIEFRPLDSIGPDMDPEEAAEVLKEWPDESLVWLAEITQAAQEPHR
jgi:predicted SprT family Zn-dependent metalloprotease